MYRQQAPLSHLMIEGHDTCSRTEEHTEVEVAILEIK